MSTQVTNTQALADLQAAIATLQGGVTSLQAADAAIDAAILKLQGSAGGGVSPADIEAAVAQLNTASAALKPVVADLSTQATTLNPPPPPIVISVSPATAGPVAQGSTQQFTATGDSAGVTWSVTGSGTIDQTGLYTPPTTTGGTDTVVATSKTDTTKSASASVSY